MRIIWLWFMFRCSMFVLIKIEDFSYPPNETAMAEKGGASYLWGDEAAHIVLLMCFEVEIYFAMCKVLVAWFSVHNNFRTNKKADTFNIKF